MGPLQVKATAVTAARSIDFEQLKMIGNCHDSKIGKAWFIEQLEDALDALLGLERTDDDRHRKT